MRLPAPLLRSNPFAHKNTFGHVLILAGSARMLGAAALTSLGAMRSGAGLVTVGIPQSLNLVIQKKIANVIMTLPLAQTKEASLSLAALKKIESLYPQLSAIAIGPGLSQHSNTQKLIQKIISTSPVPLVIDADALNALVDNLDILKRTKTIKILTPHMGEMSRLIHIKKEKIGERREDVAKNFAKKYKCTVLLKGHHTIVASAEGKIYINKTGNAGMATAGSGDVLTGMIAAFLGQGLDAFESAKWGAYIHGKAGDSAAKAKTKVAMIATDIIDYIPTVLTTMTN